MTVGSASPAPAPAGGPAPAAHQASARPPRAGAGMAPAPRSRWLVFFGLAVAVIVVDQLTKLWIVANFDVSVATPILGDSVRIWLSHNNGALFGMFRDQALVFAAFSFIVIAIIVWYEAQAGGNLLVTLSLGLLLGGAIGNLADRLRLGYVVDFVDLGIGSWRFYTFNVADSAITGSVLLLLLLAVVPGLAAVPRND